MKLQIKLMDGRTALLEAALECETTEDAIKALDAMRDQFYAYAKSERRKGVKRQKRMINDVIDAEFEDDN
jgi:hypothetical protein